MSSEREIIIALRESTSKSPDEMYTEYLDKHVRGVRDIYESILKPLLVDEGIDEDTLHTIEGLIDTHDSTKFSDDEWVPYRDYFYDNENNSRSSVEFNKAWNHHQKHNPHHWQYWVLINDVDEPQYQAMEMPLPYVIEMLADWQSAGRHYGNTACTWYTEHKDRMVFHPETRKLVEKYLEYLK